MMKTYIIQYCLQKQQGNITNYSMYQINNIYSFVLRILNYNNTEICLFKSKRYAYFFYIWYDMIQNKQTDSVSMYSDENLRVAKSHQKVAQI